MSKRKKATRKPKDLGVARAGARVKGGVIRKTGSVQLSPSPPAGPVPIPYPN